MPPKPKSSPSFPQEMEIPVPLTVHESVSPKAAALLEGVIEVLMVTPKMYDQWSAYRSHCGTPLCIIGWMAHFAGIPQNTYPEQRDREAFAPTLGLTAFQLERLYLPSLWPTPHDNAPTPAQGITRISHFITTGQ